MSSRPDICIRFGQAVRARRLEVGLSQEQLAAAASLNRTYIGDIERGARNVSLKNIHKLLAALEMTIPEFFTRYEMER